MIRQHTLDIPRNSFLLIVGLLLLVILAASTVYAVLPQYKEWKKVDASLISLKKASSLPIDLKVQIEQAERQRKVLEKRLGGDSASLPENQFESHIIGQLQEAAWANSVQLEGIRPAEGELIEHYRETLFEVTLSGGYHEIYRLLSSLKNALGFVVVKRFDLEPGSDSDKSELDVNMVLASYRLEQGQ